MPTASRLRIDLSFPGSAKTGVTIPDAPGYVTSSATLTFVVFESDPPHLLVGSTWAM